MNKVKTFSRYAFYGVAVLLFLHLSKSIAFKAIVGSTYEDPQVAFVSAKLGHVCATSMLRLAGTVEGGDKNVVACLEYNLSKKVVVLPW